MKTFISFIFLIVAGMFQAQQFTSVSEIARNNHFNKTIDEINNGKEKIKYSDIKGIPYYSAEFIRAKVGDTPNTVPIRYNTFLDTVEILVENDVYEIPREESYPKFTFITTNEKLVLVNTHDDLAGYFFEIADGKNKILKKIVTKFYDAVPPPNTLVSGTPARFETLKPMYFIKTENGLLKIPKNAKDLGDLFPNNKGLIDDFVKKNKLKMNHEDDLIKLATFLNTLN